jgi:hypothetical protein
MISCGKIKVFCPEGAESFWFVPRDSRDEPKKAFLRALSGSAVSLLALGFNLENYSVFRRNFRPPVQYILRGFFLEIPVR